MQKHSLVKRATQSSSWSTESGAAHAMQSGIKAWNGNTGVSKLVRDLQISKYGWQKVILRYCDRSRLA